MKCRCDQCGWQRWEERLFEEQAPPFTPWWTIAGDLVGFLALVVLLLLAGQLFACSAPATVVVHRDVLADHTYVEDTVREAIEFVCVFEDMDCARFQRDLRVYVYQDDLNHPGDEGEVLLGLYWHFLGLLEVKWPTGECTNALVHELVHRVSWLEGYGNGYFGEEEHGEIFYGRVRDVETAWRIERGCL